MSRKLTKEEFIEKSRAIHGNKYDYSKVEYNGNRLPVTIICPEHGEFQQIAGEHLRGHGCIKCNGGDTLTQKEFIEKARSIHGDKFDYSKTVYKNSKTKFTVICKEHGEFQTSLRDHLMYGACPICKRDERVRRICKKEFIDKASTIHGNKYDYSNIPEIMEYYNERVTLTCPVHGDFTITPYLHLEKKRGCAKCNFRGLSTEEWVERFKGVHGDRYDYSKFQYKGNDVKSTIICKKHGEFQQAPKQHLNGRGCPKCKLDKLHDLNCKTTEQFIEEAHAIHGDKYDYSKVEYINNYTPVCIICPIHGEFWQQPSTHLCQRSGCRECATIADTPRKRDTFETFTKKACKIHGDKYDYSKVEYVDSMTKVCIICPKHGEFWQRPDAHIRGLGCPKCRNHKTEEKICFMLDERNVNYEYDQPKSWLKYKGLQRLDFYLPEYNAAIEYQGEEHHVPIDFAGKGKEWAENQFQSLQKRDNNKRILCEKYGIRLYYIEYTDDIEKRLDEILFELNNVKNLIN